MRRNQLACRRAGDVPHDDSGHNRRGLQQRGVDGGACGSSTENQAIPLRKRFPTTFLVFSDSRREMSDCKT